MRVRWIGLTLALALLGAAAGYGVGLLARDEPATFAAGRPVPAVSPSYPVNPVLVLPDPKDPALASGLPLHRATVGTPPFALDLPVPKGWVRTTPSSGEWRWYLPPGMVPNTYFLRVRLIGNRYMSVTDALEERLTALQNAEDVSDFHLQTRTADGFTADYVSGDHRRVAMERFISADGSATAYASIAVIGREADREGLADLFAEVTAGATP
jgi:hypothetical protein